MTANPQSAIRNPQSAPQCSVIICAYNGEADLPACLGTLAASRGVAFETIVVDNGSADGSAEVVRRDFPGVKLILAGRNLGFAGGNNLGIRAARGEIIVLLNQDTEVPPDWLANLCAPFVRDPRIGAAGCKLFYPGGGVIQHAGGIIHANGNTDHLGRGEPDRGQWDTPGECDYVTGAALGLRRAALEEVGLLDPGYYPAYFEELDLQIRMRRAGWRIWYEPTAWVIHKEAQSKGAASPAFYYCYTKNRLRYLALHGFPRGIRAALREEKRFLRDTRHGGRLGPVLRAYAYGLLHGPAWLLDRGARRSVPRLRRS